MAIKQGDKVILEYEGKLEDGQVFDSSKHGEHSHPLEFTLGEGKILPAFEKNVEGMEKGEDKEFTLKPEEAYGQRNEEMKRDIPRSQLPEGQEPKVGMALMMSTPQGQQVPVQIIGVDDENVTIDLNHPLAGKKLVFNIKVVDINPEGNEEDSKEKTEDEDASKEVPSSSEGEEKKE